LSTLAAFNLDPQRLYYKAVINQQQQSWSSNKFLW